MARFPSSAQTHDKCVCGTCGSWHAHVLQEATQRTIGQFDAAVLEIDTEEAEELARVCAAMRRLRVSVRRILVHSDGACAHTKVLCTS